ncbi:hypothetical protein GQ668_19180, partial [Xenorhabdus nematophila]|nr:hypothetical protein [Xenorhabdus nematophila]
MLSDEAINDGLSPYLRGTPARPHAVRLDIPAPVLADEPVVRKRSCRPNFPLAFKISLAEK